MRFPLRGDSEALRREVRVSQAVNRVRQLPTVFIANPLLAAFIAVVYWDLTSRTLLVLFVAAMVVLWVPAVLSWRRLRHKARPTRVSIGNERRAVIFSVTAGALWAFAAAALFPAGGPAEQAALVMLLSGLCAGSVAFFSSSPVASMGFFLPFMLTLFVQAITFSNGENPVLPAAIGVFIACALLFSRTSWFQFVENVRVLVERDRLLQEAKDSGVQLELMLSRMSDLAMVDELTGLKNRRSFFDAIESVIAASRRRGKPVALALLDLDHFKDVNDTLGHVAGDGVLREVSKRIEDTLRQEQIVGRIGGEEFAVLLPDTTPSQALVAIERVRRAIGDTPVVLSSGVAVEITMSGGISALPDGAPVNHAMQQADRAMYRAKKLGRNRIEVFGDVEETVATA
jgi:diguanylate cyclase (GGDEF)-like protein